MFQTFDVTSRPAQARPRVTALRAALEAAGLDAFVVPRADAHQGEYVAPCDERLAWITGFTGSAGFAVIARDRAAMFTDGRYTVQVRAQCDASLFEFVDWPQTSLATWLKGSGLTRIGLDSWLHTVAEVTALRDTLAGTGIEIVTCANLVDPIWSERPERPLGRVFDHPVALAGRTTEEKFALVIAEMAKARADSLIITLPDNLSWLLNIRGEDIPRNPVVQGFAVLHASGKLDLYTEPEKVAALGPDPRITVHARSAFGAGLAALEGRVMIDPKSAPYAVVALLDAAEIVEAADPIALPKACKTAAEIAGSREAHLRDGAAMVEFLSWLDEQTPEELSERDVVTRLEQFRAAGNQLKDISFDTICGAGPNGAIVHYRVTEDTDRRLQTGELLLVDSGGQYVDGTTDITRTIALGDVGGEERAAFTAVLQGMIAISTARFPRGVTGGHLDALARAPLWRMGRDYDHGTGHGVGAYLSVHEGPQRLSRVSDVPLREGMILSNEPGYYREGAFGIRIENLIVTRAADMPEGADDRDMLDFETLTFVPIDRSLILADELAPWERDWLNAYHAEVYDKIAPRLSERACAWLRQAVAPL